MTLNSILNACGQCDAKYQELCTQEPRLTEDKIVEKINEFNEEHDCIFHINYLNSIKIFYDIYLKTGQTVYGMEYDICEQKGPDNSTELHFTKFDETTKVRYNFTCNAIDIVAIGEHYQQIQSTEEE